MTPASTQCRFTQFWYTQASSLQQMVQMVLKQLVKVGMIILTSTFLLPPQALEAKGDTSSAASRSNSACRLISAKQMHQLFGGEWAEPTPTPVKDLDINYIAGCQISTKHPYGTASFLSINISTKAQRDKNGNLNNLAASMDVAGLFNSKPIAGVGDRAIGYWSDMEEDLGSGVIVVAKGTTFVQAILSNQYRLKKANLSKLAELGKLMAPLLGS